MSDSPESTQANATTDPQPRSRWKGRRLARRFVTVFVPLLLIFVGVAMIVGQTSWFWRSVVFPRFLGPDYEKSLKLGTVSAGLFPPTIEIEGIALADAIPDTAAAPPVFSADRVKVGLGWSTRPGRIVIKTLETDGLSVAVRKDAKDRNSLTESIAALTRGLPPAASTAHGSGLPSIVIENANLDGIHFRFRHDGIEGGFLFTYWSTGPIVLSSSESADATVANPPTRVGNLNELLRIQTAGSMTMRGLGVDFTHSARATMDIADLRAFPANDMKGTVELLDGDRVILSAGSDVPLKRAVTRPKGLPFENFHLVIPGSESPNVVEVREFSFDPISGKLKGLVSTDAKPVELVDALAGLLAPQRREELVAKVRKGVSDARIFRANSRVLTELRLDGQGLGAYAAEAPGEAPPFRMESNLRITMTDIPVGALGGGKSGETGRPARLSLEVNSVLDEKTELGTVRASLTAQRDDIATVEPLFTLNLCKYGEPTQGIELRPFDLGALRRVLSKLEVPPRRPPAGIRFANYDRLTGTIGRLLSVGSDFLRVLAVENASLTFRMDLDDQQLVNDIVAPVLGRTLDDGMTMLDVALLFRGADKVNELNARLDMSEIRFPELESPIRVAAEGHFIQSGSTITAIDLSAGIAIQRGEALTNPGKFDLELALSRGGPEGEFGPPAPTRMDFSTGHGHFEVQLESLSRDMIEVLLQIQTFNLSETLAEPIYHRVFGLLGMNVDNKGASARARMYVVGDLGEIHRMRSVIQIVDLAPAAFLQLPGDDDAEVKQRVDVRWEQAFSMRRIQNDVSAEVFDLRVLDKKGEQLGSLVLDGNLPATFDLPTVEAGAAKQLESLAASAGPAAGLQELLAPILNSLALARSAARTTGSKLVFDLPKIDLSAWAETLEQSGVPIKGGNLRFTASAELNSKTLADDMSSLRGDFEANDIEFGKDMSPLPRFAGQIEIGQTGNRFELRQFETTATLDPEYAPVRIALSGSADSVAGTGSTKIAIDHLNAAVLDRLLEVKTSGLGNATAVIERIPLGRLREIAGRDAEMALRFDADSREFGRLTNFALKQSGTRLSVLPEFFAPLSFDINEEGEVDTSHGLTVRRLAGHVSEQGIAEPLLTLQQSGPFSVSREGGDGNARAEIRLSGRKDIAKLGTRLRESLLPLLGRRIEAGTAELEFVIGIPAGGLDLDMADAEIDNDLHAGILGIRLTDFPHAIDVTLDGALTKKANTVALKGVRFLANVAGQRGGSMELDAQLDTETREYHGLLKLEDWNRKLLEAMPPQYARWLGSEAPRFDATLDAHGGLDTRRHESTIRARLRNIPVPPLVLAGRSEPWSHAPLLATVDAVLAYDGETSYALAKELEVLVGTEGRDANSKPAETLARLTLARPARVPLTEAAAATDPGEVELAFVSGPLDLARYAPLIAGATGAPLTSGTLSAEARVTASGTPENMSANIDGKGTLAGGTWDLGNGATRALGADVNGKARLVPDGVVLDGLLLRLLHPGDADPEDDLEFTGLYSAKPANRRAELHIASEGIAVDRVLELFASLREPNFPERTAVEPTTTPAPPRPRTVRIPRDITGLLTLDAKQLIFRKLVFPNTKMKATLRDGRVTVEDFGIEAEKGSATLKAFADFAGDIPFYSADANVTGLAAGPWVESFAPTIAGRVRGNLDAKVHTDGRGLTPEDMARDLFARIEARVSEGHFDGTPMRWLFGDLGKIETRVNAVLSGDRLVFSADTPRDGTKDIRISGTVRNAIPREGSVPWVRAIIDLALTDERTGKPKETRDGVSLPPRARGTGARVSIEGPLTPGKTPPLKVETIYN